MLTISSVFLGILEYFLRAARFTTEYVRLVGQEPAPSNCVLMSTSRAVRDALCGVGLFLMRVIGGLSSWMFGIFGVILILLSMVGPLLWLLGFALSFFGWFLSLLSRWTFMGGSGFSVPCLFLVLLHGIEASFLAGTQHAEVEG